MLQDLVTKYIAEGLAKRKIRKRIFTISINISWRNELKEHFLGEKRNYKDEEIFYNNQLKPKTPVKEKSKKALIIAK